jgi:diguanylate cyclase (GGDEF)-like protein/PAS domain S-box-containing protein
VLVVAGTAGGAAGPRPAPGGVRAPVAGLVWQAVAAGVLLAAWWSWLQFGHADDSSRRVVSEVGFVVAPVVAGWCGVRVSRRDAVSARAWRWLAAGCGAWALASVVFAVDELGLGRLAPFPSYADVGYVGYAVPMVVGLRMLPRTIRVRTSRLRANLDAAVIVASLGFVSWSLVLGRVYRAPVPYEWYRLDAMAYPVADMVVVAVVLVVGARYALDRRLSWSLLAAGLVTLALTDSAYAVATVNGTYTAGTGFDLLWVAGFVLVALAAQAVAHPRARSMVAERLSELIAEAAPYVPLWAAVVVVAVQRFTSAPDPVALALGGVLFVLASVRQGVLVVEQRRLTHHLEEQVAERTVTLAGSETRMRALLANLSDAVMIMEPRGSEGALSYVSPSLGVLLGTPGVAFESVSQLTQRQHPDDVARNVAVVQALTQTAVPQHWQTRLAHADGAWRTIEVTATNRVADPAIGGLVLVLHDVTERERLQSELGFLAGHDPLTGLGNRRTLTDQMAAALARADRRGERSALILLDLDGFKAVNDTLGHAAGDELLVLASGRLLECARAGDLVCRLGGDEFAVLLEATGGLGEDLDDVVAAAQRILAALREPFLLGGARGLRLDLSASAGIAIRPPGGLQDGGELLREADVAMYAVKASGKDGLRIFDPTTLPTG